MKPQILYQGAEAIITKKNNLVIKNRISKSYRLKELDEKIRKSRTKKEAKLLEKASKIINAPNPKTNKDKYKLTMPYISGKKLSQSLDKLKNKTEVCKQIGQQIAILHDNNIIHGDLTTSNMILDKKNKVYFIDFGLGFQSSRIEDKAVDLHLIKQALEAKHFENWETYFKHILEGYKTSKNYSKVIIQLKKVESRGRYKDKH